MKQRQHHQDQQLKKHKTQKKKKFMAKLQRSLPTMTMTMNINLLSNLLSFLFSLLPRFLSLYLFSPSPPPPFTHQTKPTIATTTKIDTNPEEEDSSIARALSQVLSMVTEVPPSSRKYETIRNLAERLIEDNNNNGAGAGDSLREVNQAALSAAFAKTVSRLEVAILDQVRDRRGEDTWSLGHGRYFWDKNWGNRVGWVVSAVRAVGDGFVRRLSGSRWEEASPLGVFSAEKFASELIWLAERMAACGLVEEAVCGWGSASGLASLALSAGPRLQSLLVKLTGII